LAAQTHVDNSIISSNEFLKSNVNGVHHLLELIKTKSKFNMPTLYHFSTDEVYSDILVGSHKETDLLKPSNPYSASKASADMLILAWARTFGIPYVILRPTNNYGLGQYPEKLIPKTIKYLSLGRKIPLHNKGTPIRTWLHVDDTSSAAIKIMESGIKNEIFNISGNCEYKNIEVVSKIIKLMKGDVNVEDYCDFSYNRDGQDLRYSIDDSKLRNLGWKANAKFDSELKHIVKHHSKNFIW